MSTTKVKEKLIDLFNLDQLPPEKMLEMVERLGKLVFQSVLVRAIPLLSEEAGNEYDALLANNENGEALFQFLSEKVPGFEKIIEEESELLRQELAGEFTKAGI